MTKLLTDFLPFVSFLANLVRLDWPHQNVPPQTMSGSTITFVAFQSSRVKLVRCRRRCELFSNNRWCCVSRNRFTSATVAIANIKCYFAYYKIKERLYHCQNMRIAGWRVRIPVMWHALNREHSFVRQRDRRPFQWREIMCRANWATGSPRVIW